VQHEQATGSRDCAGGIRREIVRALAAGGATVFTCDIDVAALDVLAKEISGVEIVVCDISRREDIELMVDRSNPARDMTCMT
jgi:NAD(P)-dependent dehydrogenase (short-subunit alcohol dehydrogenase family)